MSTHEAWSLVCRLFAGGTPVFRGTLSPAEIVACATFLRVPLEGVGMMIRFKVRPDIHQH